MKPSVRRGPGETKHANPALIQIAGDVMDCTKEAEPLLRNSYAELARGLCKLRTTLAVELERATILADALLVEHPPDPV